MPEHVIASVLRKLGPGGTVSHEEALGGQAIRERGGYDSWSSDSLAARAADSLLADAREVLRRSAGDARELSHDRRRVPAPGAHGPLPGRPRPPGADGACLPARHGRRAERPISCGCSAELALVAAQTRPYVEDPRPLNLVGFPGATPPTGVPRAGATATPDMPAAGSRWTSTRSGHRRRSRRSGRSWRRSPPWACRSRRSTPHLPARESAGFAAT